jgi:hypothetical protein
MTSDDPRGEEKENPAREGEATEDIGAKEAAGSEEEDEYAAPEYLQLSPQEAAREAALARATLGRIERMILASGTLSAVAAAWPLGWAVAVGILAGTLLGWINFRWLAASVNAIGERIARAPGAGQGATGAASVVLRGGGRIVLIALVAYGIFSCSVHALMGYLAGLAMPVVAMMCEAAYEFAAGRRPS